MEIAAEMQHQDKKWGDQRSLTPDRWNTILSEETGELAKAILEGDSIGLRQEAVQVAAVAVQIIEAVDRDGVTHHGPARTATTRGTPRP